VIVRDDVQCVPTGCPVLVLDLREANARNLGEFWAHAVKALPTSNNGWRDLSAGGKRVTFRVGRDREPRTPRSCMHPPVVAAALRVRLCWCNKCASSRGAHATSRGPRRIDASSMLTQPILKLERPPLS
jgi:hypothetical protein